MQLSKGYTQDHYYERDFAPESSSPYWITVYNWHYVDYCLRFDTEAEREAA